MPASFAAAYEEAAPEARDGLVDGLVDGRYSAVVAGASALDQRTTVPRSPS